MPKPRSRCLDWLVYLVVRLAVCLLQALSYEAARSLAGVIACISFRLDRRHRDAAIENLQFAYPELGADERRQWVEAVYRHYAVLLVEMIHLPRRLHVHNWKRYIRVENAPELVEALLCRRPLLIVTGHHGNWEMAGYTLAMLGFRSYAVARPLDNPYLDRFLRRFREYTGQQLLAKKGELERMEAILESGDIVCMLADQDAGRRGVFVQFFGRPASTHKAIALLALEHGVTVLVAGARKVGEPMRYRIEAADIIHPAEHARDADPIHAITQRFTTAVERLVRLAPEQYLWLHRRWKHQPRQPAAA